MFVYSTIQTACVIFMKRLLTIAMLILVASCTDKTSNTTQSTVPADTTKMLTKEQPKVDSGVSLPEGKIIKFTSKYGFETFNTKVFTGKVAAPNFTDNDFSNDKEYVNFITVGCNKNGINFGGHYTIIQRSCGAMCEHIFIIDRITGKIFTDIKPNDGRYGYLYRNDSKLLIANSNIFQNDSLNYYNNFFGEPELYVWNDNDFKRLK